MKKEIATILCAMILSACSSQDRKIDTVGDTPTSYTVWADEAQSDDAGPDSSVDIALCRKDYDENCIPKCSAIEHNSITRKECIDNCVLLYKRCSHCPTADWLNQ